MQRLNGKGVRYISHISYNIENCFAKPICTDNLFFIILTYQLKLEIQVRLKVDK